MPPQGPGRNRALAGWTAAAAAGGAAGFVLGGMITASVGWEWVFLSNTPIALIGVALAPWLLPATRRSGGRRRLDGWGAVTVTAGLLALIYGLTAVEDAGLSSPIALATLTIGLALLAGFLLLESRAATPLIPLGIFRRRMLVGANVTALTLTGTTSAAAVLATTHLQHVLDKSASTTGFVFLPFSLFVVAGSAAAPALIVRFGARPTAVSGLLGVGAAMLLFTRISTAGGITYLVAGLSLAGASLGWASVAATGAGTAQARAGEEGLIAGLLNTATQLGTAMGIAVLTTVAAARKNDVEGETLRVSGSALVEGFQTAYFAAAALAVAGALGGRCAPSG